MAENNAIVPNYFLLLSKEITTYIGLELIAFAPRIVKWFAMVQSMRNLTDQLFSLLWILLLRTEYPGDQGQFFGCWWYGPLCHQGINGLDTGTNAFAVVLTACATSISKMIKYTNTVECRYNAVNFSWYYHRRCGDSSRTSIRLQTHNKHPIPRPHGRASYGVCFVGVRGKIDRVITAPHCLCICFLNNQHRKSC